MASTTALCVQKKEETGRDMRDRGVGIHLGTTYSSVAVHTHPFPSPPGVYCRPWESQCGELLHSDLIQLRFDHPDVQSYIKTVPYKVVNVENKPHVEVKLKNRITKVFSPEEICAMIPGKMKEIAEAFMGNEIEQAMHPSSSKYVRYYSKELRQSIQIAGKMARLKDVYSFPSKFAALLANREWVHEEIRVLVYNLGATAFRVSLEGEDNGYFDVVAARDDIHLGGQTFYTRLVDHFINLIKTKYRKDVSNDQTALKKAKNRMRESQDSVEQQ
ncbi:hypothetical protein V2J09_023474 [Rumex salicifolius]